MADRRRLLELALIGLRAEKERLDGEIAAVERQLGRGQRQGGTTAARRRRRRRFTAAQRKAASDRMKAYWAKKKRR